ncbi:MAG: hypothetical protein GC185_04055 [Alphaproteobacteria bacterium]|nr:hypothetical protein [Alphaproteobacteria bacterium]
MLRHPGAHAREREIRYKPSGGMKIPVKYLNLYRNIKGRYDLMMFLYKWDPDYRKDLLITGLTFGLFTYSLFTWNTVFDIIAMAVEASIIMVELGGEMSILPADYRPSHGGVRYSVQPSTHIAYKELSFLMSHVLPPHEEDALGFANPLIGTGLCRESPLVSSGVDDKLMLRDAVPFFIDEEEKCYIRSRHQLRYIAIRVANKREHTTNGVKLAMQDMADALSGERPVTVRKSYYFDALLTAEAFRSRIFRNNITGEKEVYTDLTTYFPVRQERGGDSQGVRLREDFFYKVSGHIGITTLLVTENRRVAMLHQGETKAIGSRTVTLGGSGSLDFAEIERSGNATDLRKVVMHGMAREMSEETGMQDWFESILHNTMLTGFFRWIDRCGKPEFVGITRAGDVPFSRSQSIDGDEVVKYDEIPVTINTLKDFHKVLDYVRDNNINLALSSLMALHRMTVIADYADGQATEEQRAVHRIVSEFLFGSLAYLDNSVAKPYSLENKFA